MNKIESKETDTLNILSSMLGLSILFKLPPSITTMLVYRFTAEFLTHNAFGIHHLCEHINV